LSVGPVASLLLGSQVGRTDLLQELIKLSDADAGEGLEVTRFAPQLGEGNHEPSLPYFASGLKNESMISGFVSNGYPVIAVTFQRPGQPVFQLECVIDTGFAGYLTLLLQAVQAMQLPFFYQMVINLANSSRTITDVYTRQIIWHDTKRQVEVLAMGTRPLVGRALLTGNSLSIDFRDGGEVRIERH
jgi:clan AA aspartic protease